MREIEIKARVRDIKSLYTSFKKQGIVLGDELKQHDVVYCQPGSEDNALDANWLRIRTENDSRVYFTLKRSVVGHLDSIEHETVVEDANELEKIIKLMGNVLYSDLTKMRRKVKHGYLEICLDEVPGLGTFIEVEKLMDHTVDHDAVVEELWLFLNGLGISKDDEVHEGYDVLERRLRG